MKAESKDDYSDFMREWRRREGWRRTTTRRRGRGAENEKVSALGERSSIEKCGTAAEGVTILPFVPPNPLVLRFAVESLRPLTLSFSPSQDGKGGG